MSVNTFADEMVYFMNTYTHQDSDEPGRFANIWAYSQGGVAALFALNDSNTPLDAFEDEEKFRIRTLAAEFQGTNIAGMNSAILFPLGRAIVRETKGCKYSEVLQLSPVVATLRLVQVKRGTRRATSYRRTIHRIAGVWKNWCQIHLSKFWLWGYDDGIAQNARAALYKGASPAGVDRELCHSGGRGWAFPFAVDNFTDVEYSPIPEDFCAASFLSAIPGFECPSP